MGWWLTTGTVRDIMSGQQVDAEDGALRDPVTPELQFYREAAADGASFVFHTYDEEDASEHSA